MCVRRQQTGQASEREREREREREKEREREHAREKCERERKRDRTERERERGVFTVTWSRFTDFPSRCESSLRSISSSSPVMHGFNFFEFRANRTLTHPEYSKVPGCEDFYAGSSRTFLI